MVSFHSLHFSLAILMLGSTLASPLLSSQTVGHSLERRSPNDPRGDLLIRNPQTYNHDHHNLLVHHRNAGYHEEMYILSNDDKDRLSHENRVYTAENHRDALQKHLQGAGYSLNENHLTEARLLGQISAHHDQPSQRLTDLLQELQQMQ